jgi:hypothetical protein
MSHIPGEPFVKPIPVAIIRAGCLLPIAVIIILAWAAGTMP